MSSSSRRQVIAQNHRTQERNRAEALERLVALVREAAVRPVPRRATKPPRASKQERIESKKLRGRIAQVETVDKMTDHEIAEHVRQLLCAGSQ